MSTDPWAAALAPFLGGERTVQLRCEECNRILDDLYAESGTVFDSDGAGNVIERPGTIFYIESKGINYRRPHITRKVTRAQDLSTLVFEWTCPCGHRTGPRNAFKLRPAFLRAARAGSPLQL